MAEDKEKKSARVTLLDAVDFDAETHRILKDQLSKATKYLSASFLVKWEAEIDAMLRYGIWRLSVCRHQATFGQQLLSVKYGNSFSKRKAQLLIILTVGGSYVKQKITQLSSTTESSLPQLQEIKKLLSAIEVSILIASAINLIVFLRNGEYPTLVDRILRLRPVSSASPGNSRVIGYQYMTRELLWHGFVELITFTLPLINYQSLKRRLIGYFMRNKKSTKNIIRSVTYSSSTVCTVCNEVPILPHHIGCNHTFCYYCLESNRLADKTFECPLCGHPAKNIISLTLPTNQRLISV